MLAAQVLMMLCVQGSVILPQESEESREALRDLRASLKLAIKAAWSQEAVRRGIASAKVRHCFLSAIVLLPQHSCTPCILLLAQALLQELEVIANAFVYRMAFLSARHSPICCMLCRVGTRRQRCRRMTGLFSWMGIM